MPLQDAPNGGLREAQAPGDECVGVGNAGEVGDAPVFVVKDVELLLWGEAPPDHESQLGDACHTHPPGPLSLLERRGGQEPSCWKHVPPQLPLSQPPVALHADGREPRSPLHQLFYFDL